MEDNLIQPYQRYGYVPDSPLRLCDEFMKIALDVIPPDVVLPKRWKHGGDPASFLMKYGKHRVSWALSYNSCTLLLNGFYIFRVWTNTKYSFFVDISEELKGLLDTVSEPIPTSCVRKSKPLYSRIKLSTLTECDEFIRNVKDIYGI